MPPPAAAPKSAPRGNSFIGIQRSASTGTQDGGGAGPTPPTASQRGESGPPDMGGGSVTQLPPSLAHSQQQGGGGPPSPSYSQQSGSASNHRRGNDGGDDIRQIPSQTLGSSPLPSTHSPHHTGSQGPAMMPSSSSEPRAPGSGVFVKRKVKKAPTSSGDTPQPSRKSPHRGGSEGSSTPRVRSILRNPMARHSTVTFSADVVGLTLEQLDAIPVLKKADVEQSTMRDEVFASLHGPVSSREQITVNITADDDGQGVRIEGIIDHLRNNDEQNAVIRRLADFLHSPNVFGRSLAPFLALGGTAGDRTLNEAVQRILVREARINDVPIKTVAPSMKSMTSQGGATPKSKTGASVSTPSWDPDYSPTTPHELGLDASQAVARYERRRKAYQASLGIVYASPLAIPTPHQGRWDRPNPDPYVVRPDPVEANGPPQPRSASLQGHFSGSNRGLVDTPRSNLGSSRGYTFLPHGVVDSPTTEHAPSYYPPVVPASDGGASPNNGRQQFSTQLALQQQQQHGGRLLMRDPGPFYQQGGTNKTGGGNMYRTRQYVTEDPPRSVMRR